MDDSSLCSLFQEQEKQPEEMSISYKELHSLFPDYSKHLKKNGVTRNQLFKEYQSLHSGGYARSRFCTYLQAYLALSHPIAHLEHKAGDKMYIDYAGDKLSLIDRETGEILCVEVFAAILPCGQLTYVEAVMSQRKEDLIHACEALELHNNALLTGRSYSRREQYEEIERDCTGPLNPIRFELKQRHTATVQKNRYIRLERHYYSVPYPHIGKKVNVLYK